MYSPQLLDELARIFAEAALERLLAESVGSSGDQEPCNSQCAKNADLTIIDAVTDAAKDDNISQ